AKAFDVVISQHAQDANLTEGWQMHEGHYSAMLDLVGAPSAAEAIIVARDLELAALTGGRLHVTHLSAARSVELVAQGKERGLREPGHLSLLRAIEAMSTRPARILGHEEHGGPIVPGRAANLVVFDPAAAWTVGERPWASMARNSAFTGRRLRGRVVHTLRRG